MPGAHLTLSVEPKPSVRRIRQERPLAAPGPTTGPRPAQPSVTLVRLGGCLNDRRCHRSGGAGLDRQDSFPGFVVDPTIHMRQRFGLGSS